MKRDVVSLLWRESKVAVVEIAAKVTSKGQVTLPKAVRDALGVGTGDSIVFRVEGARATIARTPDFLDLAGSLSVPAAKRNVAWDAVLRSTRESRVKRQPTAASPGAIEPPR